ncbi:hypothetical protein H6802_01580 [Candidatus Nomurabacteria bacterium]|nr:hypothetical protein [Candidatus Nomurabacteria bacterium]MCB9827420.1 hypothetical protein [Candidatus Nomurabacteria bacterium]
MLGNYEKSRTTAITNRNVIQDVNFSRRAIVLSVFIFLYFFLLSSFLSISAQVPASSSFVIKGENVSPSGGVGSTPNFMLNADLSPFSQSPADASSFKAYIGYNPRIQANTPYEPTLDNATGQYYDRLLLTIDPSGNPTDTLFAVAISANSWSTTYYVQNDNTLALSLGPEDYRTYAGWGGSGGTLILGLSPSSSYVAKVKALNGDFTETLYGPESSAVETVVPFISLSVSSSVSEFGVLSANEIKSASSVDLSVTTNAESGYSLSVNGTGSGVQPGLYNGVGNVIVSQDTVLSVGTEGYGAQGSSGTATISSKYDLAGDFVGSLDLSPQELASNSVPVSGDSSTITFKASISGNTVAGEYEDIVYFTISPSL